MATILLIIIYIAAISLGIPDSLLGAGWPAMCEDLEGTICWAGTISMVIAGGTVVSSLYSYRLIRKFGIGKVTVASVAITALALMGFSMSREFVHLCLWAIPYGLGAGCVDVALNNYVALHYQSRHMSWLHCLWGVGAAIGPLIMGKCLIGGLKWTAGYQITGILQIILTTVLFCVLSFWERTDLKMEKKKRKGRFLTLKEVFQLPGAGAVMTAFFCYSALENTAGLWAGSYMVFFKGVDAGMAASWACLFYLGIAAGRFLTGFITDYLGDKNMIRAGQIVAVIGVGCLMTSDSVYLLQIGMMLLGFGLAPIYPSLIHATPAQFGEEKSQIIMGVQMAFAYAGSILMPTLLGWMAEVLTIQIYPAYLLLVLILLFFMAERMNMIMRRR